MRRGVLETQSHQWAGGHGFYILRVVQGSVAEAVVRSVVATMPNVAGLVERAEDEDQEAQEAEHTPERLFEYAVLHILDERHVKGEARVWRDGVSLPDGATRKFAMAREQRTLAHAHRHDSEVAARAKHLAHAQRDLQLSALVGLRVRVDKYGAVIELRMAGVERACERLVGGRARLEARLWRLQLRARARGSSLAVPRRDSPFHGT